MKQQICYLFDIDGTLLTVGHRGRQAFCGAIAQACHDTQHTFEPNMAGRTDLSILQEAMAFYGQELTPSLQIEIFANYLALLTSLLADSSSVTVFPGAYALLDKLQQAGGTIALGTGNMRQGAIIKMEKAGLWSFVQAGGYGDDHHLREKVLAIGVKRAAEAKGLTAFDQVWVIGDTPLDIAAGKAIGAKTCAIANGRYNVTALSSHHPDLAFANLEAAINPLLQLL